MSGVNVEIRAGYDQLRSGFAAARETLKGAVDGMKSELKAMSDQAKEDGKGYESVWEQFGNVVAAKSRGINGAIAGIRTAWAQLAVVAAAGLGAKEAIDETVRLTTEAQKLSRALNITASEASVLNIAIGDVYGTTDQYLSLAQGMNRQLKMNEDGLQSMGLKTRDANGELRDQQAIILDALDVLRQYEAGTNRNLAATQLFGRGVDVSSEMLALNAERIDDARRKAEELGAVIGEENVEATNEYRAAMNDLGDVLDACKKVIGEALMPALTEFAQFCSDIGPTAVLALKIAIGSLVALFHGLVFAVKTVWNLMRGFFANVGDIATTFGQVMKAVFSGDIAGAQAAAGQLFEKLKTNASDTFARIASDAGETTDKIFKLFSAPTATTAKGDGSGKQYEGEPDKEADKEKARKAREALKEAERARKEAFDAEMETLRGELDAWKNNYDERIRIAREMAEAVKRQYGADSAEYKKAQNAIVDIERQKAEQIKAIREVESEKIRADNEARIQEAERAADLDYSLGLISYQQRLAAQADFENARFEMARADLDARLALMQSDPDMNPVEYARLKNEIAEVERQHRARMHEIANNATAAAAAPMSTMFDSMESSFSNAMAGILTRQQSASQILKSTWQSLYGTFVSEMVTKPLSAFLMGKLRESAIGKMMAALHVGTQASASAAVVGTKAGETTAVVGMNAAQAGAGAAASQASIPFVGPVLALAAMAAVFAAVSALGKGGGSSTTTTRTELPSAAGGFDIPSGVNPVTQLHEREMVLPSKEADTIRELGEGGGGLGPVSISIQALDGQDVKRVLMQNKGALADALKAAIRDFKR